MRKALAVEIVIGVLALLVAFVVVVGYAVIWRP